MTQKQLNEYCKDWTLRRKQQRENDRHLCEIALQLVKTGQMSLEDYENYVIKLNPYYETLN
jgi:hypothetical protein